MPSDWNICDGQGDATGTHCCWVDGEPCTHLQVDGPSGRKYACGLFVELGDWALVHADARYQATPKPTWDRIGVVDCGNWWGPTRETAVALKAAGGVTKTDVAPHTQCCFRRRVSTGKPPDVTAVVNAVNTLLSKTTESG